MWVVGNKLGVKWLQDTLKHNMLKNRTQAINFFFPLEGIEVAVCNNKKMQNFKYWGSNDLNDYRKF